MEKCISIFKIYYGFTDCNRKYDASRNEENDKLFSEVLM